MNWPRWLAPACAALAALAIYAPFAADAGYLQDDGPAFLQHPAVAWPPDWTAIARAPYFGDAEHAYIRLSRPLVTLSFAVEKGLGLDASAARHGVEVLLYALICAWLALWAARLAPPWAALLAGVWFAMHPAHAEVVMQVAYRPELFALLFELAAFEVLWRWRRASSPPSRARAGVWLLSGSLALAAALASKEQPIALILLAWLWASARPGLVRRMMPILLAWTLLGLAWLAWRHALFGPVTALPISEADNPLAVVPASVRVQSALAFTWRAFQHLCWPVDLAPDYAFLVWPPLHTPGAETLAGALMLGLPAVGMAWLWWRARQNPPQHEHLPEPREFALLGLAFALLAWLPVSNLLFASTTLYATRLTFAPSVVLCVGLPVALARWHPRLPRLRPLLVAVLVAMLLPVCWLEVRPAAAAWQADWRLYSRGVRLQPDSLRMQVNLALVLAQRGQIAAAWPHLERARTLRPLDQDVLRLGLELAKREPRCAQGEVYARTLASLAKPAHAARAAALDWAMACKRWSTGWAALRPLPAERLRGHAAIDAFAVAIAAHADAEAEAWVSRVQPAPWQDPAWASAGVFGAEAGGRPLLALQRLAALAQAHPDLPGLQAAAQDLYQRHRHGPDAPSMLALLTATWPTPHGEP